MTHFGVAAAVHTRGHHAIALGRLGIIPVAAGGLEQVPSDIAVKVGLRGVEGRMRSHEARHREERSGPVARLQEADRLVSHPVGGVQALLEDPRVADPRVAFGARAVDVGVWADLGAQEAEVVVVHVLVHPMGDVAALVAAQIPVVEPQGLEAAGEARRVHVELAHAGGLIAGVAKLLGHHMGEVP